MSLIIKDYLTVKRPIRPPPSDVWVHRGRRSRLYKGDYHPEYRLNNLVWSRSRTHVGLVTPSTGYFAVYDAASFQSHQRGVTPEPPILLSSTPSPTINPLDPFKKMTISDDGNISMLTESGAVLWESGTGNPTQTKSHLVITNWGIPQVRATVNGSDTLIWTGNRTPWKQIPNQPPNILPLIRKGPKTPVNPFCSDQGGFFLYANLQEYDKILNPPDDGIFPLTIKPADTDNYGSWGTAIHQIYKYRNDKTTLRSLDYLIDGVPFGTPAELQVIVDANPGITPPCGNLHGWLNGRWYSKEYQNYTDDEFDNYQWGVNRLVYPNLFPTIDTHDWEHLIPLNQLHLISVHLDLYPDTTFEDMRLVIDPHFIAVPPIPSPVFLDPPETTPESNIHPGLPPGSLDDADKIYLYEYFNWKATQPSD